MFEKLSGLFNSKKGTIMGNESEKSTMTMSHRNRIWISIPTTFKWFFEMQDYKLNLRKVNGQRSILAISLCTLIEGFLSDVIESVLEERQDKKIYTDKVVGYFSKALNDVGFEKLLTLYDALTEVQMKTSKHYKGVKMLFQLRNNIIHGTGITTSITGNEDEASYERSFSAKYNDVARYLIEKKIIGENNQVMSPVVFYDLNALNHFHEETHNFLFEALEKAEFERKEEFRKMLISAYNYDSTEYM